MIVECDDLFGIGIKRMLKLESSAFRTVDSDGVDMSSPDDMADFIRRLVQCLKMYSHDSISKEEDMLYVSLWASLTDVETFNDLTKYMNVSYYDADVEDFVALIDEESWKEFKFESKKRVKVQLRTSFLSNVVSDGVPTMSQLLDETEVQVVDDHIPVQDLNEITEVSDIHEEDNANDSYGKYQGDEDEENGTWLIRDDYDLTASFLVDNDGDLLDIISDSGSEDETFAISRLASGTEYGCPGAHWIKSPHHVPPIGAQVLSVNGVNINLLDRDFQLALLKQRSRPLYIVFGLYEDKSFGVAAANTVNDWNSIPKVAIADFAAVTSDAESTPDKTWHVVKDSVPEEVVGMAVPIGPKTRTIITLNTIQNKYSHSSMTKVRKTVDNLLKEYVSCDWLTAMRDKTGTPQATAISLYKYIESEMIKLGLVITSSDLSKRSNKLDVIEAMDEDSLDQISNHIEAMIYQRISEHTLLKIAIPYIASINRDDPVIGNTNVLFDDLCLKLSFLRFVKINQLGLQGLKESVMNIPSETLIEREEWRLVMKGLCRALQFSTPSMILSKIVITIRLISQALDALLNRPNDSNISIVCNLMADLDEHHHVDNIFTQEEYEALQLLITSHEKYPSATSTDVLMLQKILSPIDTSSAEKNVELSADELLPAIAWSVIQANPSNIESILWICSEFRNPKLLRGEEAYCLAQLTSAVEFVKRIDETMLDMTKEEYEREYERYLLTQNLFDCCRTGASTKEVGTLLERGANINSLTLDQSDTPLTLSIRNEYHHLISYLIKQPSILLNRPISPCKGTNQNSTALLEAVRYNQISTVLKLLKNGGFRYHSDDNGQTALSIAIEKQYHDVIMVLQADPYRINYLDAIETEQVDLIRGLLLQGVDINMFLYDPSTAGFAAQALAMGDNIEFPIHVDLMLTPLMAATGCPNLYIIRTIIDADGIDVNITSQSDPYQDTALSYCIKRCCGLAPSNYVFKTVENGGNDNAIDIGDMDGNHVHLQVDMLTTKDREIKKEPEMIGALKYHVIVLAILIQAGATKDMSIIINAASGEEMKPVELLHQQLLIENPDHEDMYTAMTGAALVSAIDRSPTRSKSRSSSVIRYEPDDDSPFPTTNSKAKAILSSNGDVPSNDKDPSSLVPSTVSTDYILDILAYYASVKDIDEMISITYPLLDVYDLFLYDPSIHEIYELARERNYRGVISLLRQGVDINKPDPQKGYTSLIAATFNQDYLMVELLLRSQSIIADSSPLPDQAPGNIYTTVHEPLKPPSFLDINRPGRGGMRPLHYAAQLGDVKIIGRLLQASADRYLRNKKGLTPFDVALVGNHVDAINTLRYDPNQISVSIAAKHGDWTVVKALLNQGVSVNATPVIASESASKDVNASTMLSNNIGMISSSNNSPDLYTPLIAAASHGQHDIIKQLLHVPDINVNIANLEGQTALMFAAGRGDEPIVLQLLNNKADRWLRDSKGKLAADYALTSQHELIHCLLQHDPAQMYVHEVIRNGNFNAVVAMFKQGVDPNHARYYMKPSEELIESEDKEAEDEESNPYHMSKASSSIAAATKQKNKASAVGRPRSPSQHSKYIENHANTKDNSTANEDTFIPGETPLCIACYYGRRDVVRLLLKAPNIKVNQTDAQGWTPLHYAAYMNYEDVVIRLLKVKCNRRIFDLTGRTPVDVAIERGYHIIASLIEADPYIVHIHDMCEVGKILLVLALLKQGCPPTYRDERPGKNSQTPLMAACRGNQIEIVRMLLRYTEVVDDINARDEKGMTALMVAAKIGALDITSLLLNAGCDRDMVDEKGLSARDYAASHSFTVMFQFMSQTIIR